MADGTCSVPTCPNAAHSRTWCRTHYNRWNETGDVQAHIPIKPRRANYPPGTLCSVPTCDEQAKAHGMCKAHRLRVLDTGDARPDERIRRKGRLCSAPNCDEPSRSKTFCRGHYRREWKTGDARVDEPLRPYLVEDLEAHFWSKVDKSGPIPAHRPELGQCWLWTDAPNNSGYGTFVGGRIRDGAHRVALRLAGIEIPDGHEPDHLCRVRLCVRRTHLDPVTHAENVQRAAKLITACPSGHEYDEANTYITPKGRRKCRRCARERARRNRANS